MNKQTKMYTYNDLMAILETDYSVVDKKVEKYKFKVTKQVINNRPTKTVNLTEEEVNALVQDITFNKQKYSSRNKQIISDEQPVNNKSKDQPQPEENTISFIREMVNKNESLYKQLLSDKERQVLLLEDSEKRKENEYIRQISELKTENERLQNLNKESEKPIKKSKKSLILNIILGLTTVILLCSVAFLATHKKPPEVKTVEVPKIVTKTVIQKVPVYIRGRRR